LPSGASNSGASGATIDVPTVSSGDGGSSTQGTIGQGGDGHIDLGTTDPGIVLTNPQASAGAARLRVTGTIRDFSVNHEDFEKDGPPNAVIQGMVQPLLGSDGTPVYAFSEWVTAQSFAQWYHTIDGVNVPYTVTLELTEESPGVFSYVSNAFFPIDGLGFGNEGNDHNFHFTSVFVSRFTYNGGEEFSFIGDDDLWVFINGKLAIDLGGTHTAYTASVNLDAAANELDLRVGQSYELALFHAERHTTESNYRIDTTIQLQPIVK
jgi:fibro-slime domain-containing protein